MIHKGTAVVFVLLGFYHAWFSLMTRRGRQQLWELLPRLRDVKDVIDQQRYNLGFLKERPCFAAYSYIEKSEYWALLWGSVVMVMTGAILTFENFFMQYFPKWALDLARTIHFYEAVLAVLAIIVWHFYFVIFDPEAYPLSPAMFTGKVHEKEKAIEELPKKKTPSKEEKPE
jgi:cytochrome b subunit of formate dehydrogenase